MDALAGYGSSDDSSKASSSGAGIKGLLGHLSDDESHDDEGAASTKQNSDEAGPMKEKGDDEGVANGDGVNVGKPEKKRRRRRWDNPNEVGSAKIGDVLPPPTLLKGTPNEEKDSFQSIALSKKDYTAELRQKLSRQLQTQQSQGEEIPAGKQQLNSKLQQLYDKFHAEGNDSSSVTSFAAHIKSQHEFGNPHLLKNIIDHFEIKPLDSHVGNSFKGFEYVDKLVAAEERARINQSANYDA